jgi:hypothetical protein
MPLWMNEPGREPRHLFPRLTKTKVATLATTIVLLTPAVASAYPGRPPFFHQG